MKSIIPNRILGLFALSILPLNSLAQNVLQREMNSPVKVVSKDITLSVAPASRESLASFVQEGSRYTVGSNGSGDPILVAPVAYYSGGSGPISVSIADLNGDGKPDLVVTNRCVNGDTCGAGTVGVLLGNGDGTFQPAVTHDPGGTTPSSTFIADVNNDGKLDLVVANNSAVVAILLGNGDGTFQSAVTYNAGGCSTSSVVAADLNGDGKLDLVVDNPACPTNYDGIVGILLGNGDGTFQPVVTYDSGGDDQGAFSSVVVADLNRDGKPDVAISNTCGSPSCLRSTIGVLLGNGNGTFQPAVTYDEGGDSATSMTAVDINKDGNFDLIVAGSSIDVLLGNGDGTFQPPVGYGSGTSSVKLADINGDGNLDLVSDNYLFNNIATLGIFFGEGDGTFQQPINTVVPNAGPSFSIAVQDLNGDGRPDVVMMNPGNSPNNNLSTIGVLLNNLGPHTSTTTALISNSNPTIPGHAVTYTATVTGQIAPITGTVTFRNGSATIATVPLVNTRAACTTTYKRRGVDEITAAYSGDLHNSVSASSLTQVVERPTNTVSLMSNLNPSHVSESVTLTAKVATNSNQTPTGVITFTLRHTILGTAALVNGQASFQYVFTAKGEYPIVAAYSGDNLQTPNASAAFDQVVELNPTTTALNSNLNPSVYGQAVTFTATVTSPAPDTPTGRVVFKDGMTVIGSANLSVGIANLTKPKLAIGVHSITATYEGDFASAKGTSTVLSQTVN